MRVVGLVSAYREGALVADAIRSLVAVRLDRLYVYEGPAGTPLGDEAPASEYPHWEGLGVPAYTFREGRWRTDARKRDAMLQEAKRDFPAEPLWGVIVDGDEILRNGDLLRARLQQLLWDDEARRASISHPENTPWIRWPLRIVEADGSIALVTGRVVRLDLVRSIDVSTSVITNVGGIVESQGNHDDGRIWIDGWMRAAEQGHLIAWPPTPQEAYLVHRAHLRHPARRGLRLSAQEAVELARAQAEAERR